MHVRLALVLSLFAIIAGCDGRDPAASAPGDVAAWDGEPLYHEPWLREAMHPNALMYQRIPNPAALFAAPKGGVLGTAMASRANAEATGAILAAIDAIAAEFSDESAAIVAELAGRVRSPLEFAAIASPRPTVLTALTLDMRSIGELQNAFALLAEAGVGVSLADTPDFDGFAEVAGLPLPTVLRFESATGRLLLLSGQGLDADAARRIAGQLADGATHPMRDMETRIDESGQGLVFWIDIEQALPMAQLFLPPDVYATIESMRLDDVRAAAAGFGIASGKGRFAIALDLGDGRAEQPFPVVRNDLSAMAVGAPDAVLLVSLPDPGEFRRLEEMFLAAAAADDRDEWARIKATLADEFRFDIERVLAAVGPELMLVFDSAGDIAAVRVRDADAFDAFVDTLAALPSAKYEEILRSGITINHLRLPDLIVALGEASGLENRFANHFYWVRDGDYAYVAEVPQALLDRQRNGADASVADWLDRDQGIDASASVLLATSRIDKAPRRLYYGYLTALQFLADLSGAEIDLGAMPTADELGLPDDAAVGLQISLGDPVVSMELVYDSNPGAFLVGAGPQLAAVGGILAAIAIPAYQDYTIRAQVAEGLILAAATRSLVAEHRLETGKFPDADVIAGWQRPTAGRHVSDVEVMPGSGIIVIGFDTPDANPALHGGARLYIEPEATPGGGVTWTCSGTIEQKYLPADCRGNAIPAAMATDPAADALDL